MKRTLERLRGPALAAALALLEPTSIGAQVPTCSLPECTPSSTCGGCSLIRAVWHESVAPCGPGGGFDLRLTDYRDTCTGCYSPCPRAGEVPTPRFWQFDRWTGANSGCEPTNSCPGPWLVNGGVDEALSPAGIWYLWQAGYAAFATDGCPSEPPIVPEVRTAVDVSFAAVPTAAHTSWYLIASVDAHSSPQFDFDRLTAGETADVVLPLPACSSATIPAQEVPALSEIQAGATPVDCAATPGVPVTVTTIPGGCRNVTVRLKRPAPDYWSEVGRDDPTNRLVAGYQILYTYSATDPITSDRLAGVWKPVNVASLPAQALGIVRYGTPEANVCVPRDPAAPTTRAWLATRIVYADAVESPTESFPVGSSGPLLTTHISAHCKSWIE